MTVIQLNGSDLVGGYSPYTANPTQGPHGYTVLLQLHSINNPLFLDITESERERETLSKKYSTNITVRVSVSTLL